MVHERAKKSRRHLGAALQLQESTTVDETSSQQLELSLNLFTTFVYCYLTQLLWAKHSLQLAGQVHAIQVARCERHTDDKFRS